ncbi:MAG: Rrf2 family transcriptional regulator [Acidimicrobiia bacterium]|nr:Rrf2 family transcriptional regulator [Acidimicrobiia bacterium]
MRISKSEEYGMRLVMRLAENGGQLNIRELAEHEQLPETTVAKVIARLRREGVVRAERGRNGGYSLTTSADQISVGRVVEAFNNRIYDPDFCERMSPGDGACAHSSSCSLRPVWRGLTTVIADFLAGITVADVIAGGPSGSRNALPLVAGQKS